MEHLLWDMAGVDGLSVAQQIFGTEVGYLAPFQSMETVLDHKNCSVLRLCDRNFRISYPGTFKSYVEPFQADIWCQQFDWLTSLVLPTNLFSTILSYATVRPPHRLKNLPDHQAVPIQLGGIPVLLWRHPHQGKASLELHFAKNDLKILQKIITANVAQAFQ